MVGIPPAACGTTGHNTTFGGAVATTLDTIGAFTGVIWAEVRTAVVLVTVGAATFGQLIAGEIIWSICTGLST